MELAYAFFARAAEFTPDGRFFVLGGGIEAIRSAQFPTTLEALCLVVKLRVRPEECPSNHRLSIRPRGPDGSALGPDFVYLCGPIARPERPDQFASLGLTVSLQGLRLPREGLYTFAIVGDEQELGRVTLLSELSPPPNASLRVAE